MKEGTSGVSGVRLKAEQSGQQRLVMDYRSKGGVDTAHFSAVHDKAIEAIKKKHGDGIEGSTQKIAALKEVEASVHKILDKLSALQGPYGGAKNGKKNVFSNYYVNVQNRDPSDNKIYLDCSVEPHAEERELGLSIEQLASKDKTIARGDLYPEHLKTALNLTGTLTVNGKDLVVDAMMTLENIAKMLKITSKEGGFEVFLDTLKPETASSGGKYRLQLRSVEEGIPLTLSESEGSTVLAGLNMGESGKTHEQLCAQVTIDGMTITRISNKITDAITGFNFVLLRETFGLGADCITVKTEKNLVGIRDAVFELAEALKGFYLLENKYCLRNAKHEPVDGAVLAGDRSMEKVCKDLSDFMRGTTLKAEKGDVRVGSELGFSLQRLQNGVHQFSFDQDKLIKFLMGNPEKIERFFALKCESSSPSFEVLQAPSHLSSQIQNGPLRLKVWKDHEEPRALRASFKAGEMDWIEATVDGSIIQGKGKTIYDSFSVLFFGSLENNLDAVDSFVETTLTLRQGKADELVARLSEGFKDKAHGGVLAQAILAAGTEKDKIKDKMDKEVADTEKKRDATTESFEKVHKISAKHEEVKKLLKAQESFFNSDK